MTPGVIDPLSTCNTLNADDLQIVAGKLTAYKQFERSTEKTLNI
jgi:hypothetical protein